MIQPWEQLLRPSVVSTGRYVPGVSAAAVKQRFGLVDVVRLNWNENPDGALPGVLEEVAADLSESWAYPEQTYDEFRAAVARWAGATTEEVVPGHGIQALALSVCAAFIEPGDAVVVPHPTYGLYAKACGVAGATVHRVDCSGDPELALDLDAIAAAASEHGAKLVWVCDPNNPTGRRLELGEWEAFLAALPQGCVAIVDEAYADYVEPDERIDHLTEIRAGAPIVVLRTFSKIFGLAGLRLGYALMSDALAPYLHTVQEVFNVNRPALSAGLASLRRVEMLPARRERARRARSRLAAPLNAAGIRCLESHAPFVLVDLAGADDALVGDALAHDGLLVRPGNEFGLPGYVRVTLASDELMDAVAQRILAAREAVAAGI